MTTAAAAAARILLVANTSQTTSSSPKARTRGDHRARSSSVPRDNGSPKRCAKVSAMMDDDIISILSKALETTPASSTASHGNPTAVSDALLEADIESWQLYVGFFAGLAPFIVASYEFGKRILMQRRCAMCRGTGLIRKGGRSRKCTSCGGFLPWESWERFFDVNTAAKIGNGGRVRVPEEQTSVFYDVEKTVEASKRAKRDGEETVAARAERGDIRVEKEDRKEERA